MQYVLMVAISLHVLAAVFWAGTTFALARTGGGESRRLFRAQMGAAAVALLTGGYLMHVVHRGAFGPVERSLAVGALCALAAVAIQAIVVGMALKRSRDIGGATAAVPSPVVAAHRAAAVLLGIAAVAMAAARYM